jgi:hypothetical protein
VWTQYFALYHFNHFRPNILSSFKYFLKIVKQDKCPKHSESSKLLFPAYYCVQHIIMSSNVLFQAKYCVHTCLICDPSFMFMFTLTNTGNLCSILYVHVYTYQYRKSMIHPLCSCLHLPIQEICAPSFMFMFTLTNTGNL